MSSISEAYVEKIEYNTTSLVNYCTKKQQNFSLYDLTHKRCFSCDCDKMIPQERFLRKCFRHCDGCLFHYKQLLQVYGSTSGTRLGFEDVEPFLAKDYRYRKDSNSPAQYYNKLVAFGFCAFFIGNKCHDLILDDNSRETLLSIFDAYYQESKHLYESRIFQSGKLHDLDETIPESDFIISHKEKEYLYLQLIEQKVEDEEENFRSILFYLTPESQEDFLRYGRLYLAYIDKKVAALVKNDDTKPGKDAPKKTAINKETIATEAINAFNSPLVEPLFKLTISKGLMAQDGDKYRWLGTTSLFGYFVDKTGILIDLVQGGRIQWKYWQYMFQMEDSEIATAKQAINMYKNKGGDPPKGDDVINGIIRRLSVK